MLSFIFTSTAIAVKPPKDTTPPVVTITNPVDGTTVSGIVTISFTATDESPITAYEILVDSVLKDTTQSYAWDTTSETDGTHLITCRAKDNAKNVGETTISVTVDNGGSPPVESAFKVMSYNVEASGVNADWKQVVKEENPDILVLVETGTWDNNGNYVLNQVVNEFNTYFIDELPYEGYCAQSIVYSTSGEAILSRFPIISFNQIGIVPLDDNSDYDVTHDFVEAVVTIDGTNVHIFGTHLKAMSGAENEYRRERETEGIINYMDNLGDVPIMYMGDLNTFSPDDVGNLAPEGDLGYGPMTMKLYPGDATYGQYSSTVHTFTDVFRTLNPTDPGYTYGHQDPIYTSRIDYIVVNSFFADKLVNSTCGDTLTADTGSDHYSVDMFVAMNTTTEPDPIPPAQVTGLSATTISMSQIDLSWDANTEPDISHYRVYRDTALIAQTIGASYSDVGLDPNTQYTYEVSAIDTSINEGLKSDSASATTNDGGDADLVVINEFLPDPYVLYTQEWVELYNPQALEADLSGYILDDIVGGGTIPYTIPAGTVIPGQGFVVLYQGSTGVGLNNAGDTVNLIKPDGSTVVDSYSYPSSVDDISYGRETDGSTTWTTFTSPTPGETNGGSLSNGDSVLINEFLPDPNTLYTEEWIELYNPLDSTVDISGYVLDDLTSGGTNPYTIPGGTTIPAYGFIVFYQTTTNIALNNDGDTVNYLKPDGTTVLDSYVYSTSTDDISYGRETDGSSTWVTFDTPTPGASNGAGTNNGDSILVNEILPDPYSLYTEEWIELYNPLSVAVDISGYVLDDITSGGTNPYTIPADTIIPALGFAVFYQTTTNIALNNDGDTINYLKPDGVTVLDSYTYGSSVDDISYGRETDGSSTWVTFDTPTPGESNGIATNDADSILINEYLPDPYTLYTEEWIELYNPLDRTVDISGYVLDDLVAGGTSPYTIPGGTTIPAFGFIVFYQSTTNIGLNNDGDTVNYLKPDGETVLDSNTYSSSSNDVSKGRENDGSTTWTTFTSPTPGSSNEGTSTPTLVHVDSITFSSSTPVRTEILEITIRIVDGSNNPVEGVSVSGELQLPDSTVLPYSGETDSNGEVVFTYYYKNNKQLPIGVYTFTVTDLSGTGFEYDSAANVETSDSWTKA